MNEFLITKGKEKFVFRYESGDEPRMLDALVEMVHRPSAPPMEAPDV